MIWRRRRLRVCLFKGVGTLHYSMVAMYMVIVDLE